MSEDKDEVVPSEDVHFEPVVVLPEVEVYTLEEEEEELLKLRGKLYRYCNSEEPAEWKERGTGEVKILKHPRTGTCRILMRRDKTLKICANHCILPWMELKPNCGSDKAWVWSTPADFADEEAKMELLALRFGNAENARKFKDKFDECKDYVAREEAEREEEGDSDQSKDTSTDEVAEKLGDLKVKDSSGDSDKKSPEEETKPSPTAAVETKDCKESQVK